jgi:galactose mutarotase-like enzyme
MFEPNGWIAIASDQLSAEIDPQGAQLSRLTSCAGEELLWDGNPSVWSGRAPLLFPIVGALMGGCYRLGSKKYRLPRHGFARNRMFLIVSRSESATRLRLSADAQTLETYPFQFTLEVEFRIDGAALSVTSTILHLGAGNLFASFGYHPALRWPLPFGQARDAHFIEFALEEKAPVRRIDAAGLLLPNPVPTPVNARRLPLSDALFADDVVIFDRLQSRSLSYGGASAPRIRVDFPDARYLGIWSKPGAGFVCIEPWHGVTDPAGYTGDFSQKPGVFAVAQDAEFSSTMSISLMG